MTDLKRRVGIFAALADPTRLQIVDLLTLGDLSSSEIEVLLDLRSNLVAHHLRVLEKAQIISRTRSESDRRRTYIGLHAEVFGTLMAADVDRPQRVVFVCTANSARSQLAEALWRQSSDIPVASAGVDPGPAVNPAAVAVAARNGLEIDVTRRTRTVDDVVGDDDFVITVCDGAHEILLGRDDLHWSVPDPARVNTPEAFDRAFAQIARHMQALLARLRD